VLANVSHRLAPYPVAVTAGSTDVTYLRDRRATRATILPAIGRCCGWDRDEAVAHVPALAPGPNGTPGAPDASPVAGRRAPWAGLWPAKGNAPRVLRCHVAPDTPWISSGSLTDPDPQRWGLNRQRDSRGIARQWAEGPAIRLGGNGERNLRVSGITTAATSGVERST